MYKLIALDMDGTLLNNQKEISERNVEAIKNATKCGYKIVLASARPFYRLKRYLIKLGLISKDQFTIAFNGGIVVNNTEDLFLFTKTFAQDDVMKLINIGQNFCTDMFLYSYDGIISNSLNEEYVRKNPDANYSVNELSGIDYSETSIYKFTIVNNPVRINEIRKALPVNLKENFEITSSSPEFIEFACKGITKAHALEHISDKLEIGLNEMIAFGDEDNDLPMLNCVGYSVAMGNGSDVVKKQADYVTFSNEEDGVAHAIEKICF